MKEQVKERIQALYEEHGEITPDIVIADAKKKSSPLHAYFEWDLKKAARQAWVYTARKLINSVEVVVHTERVSITVPRYVRNPERTGREQGYRETASFKTEKDLAREVLVSEFERARLALVRARKVAIVLNMEDTLDHLVRQIDVIHEEVQMQ